jgi:hypothetical protein
MPRKSFTPERIIAKLRQIEVLIGQGQSVAGGGRHLGAELLPLAQRVWGHGCDPSQATEGSEARESAAEKAGGRSCPGQGDARRGIPGKLLSPKRRCQAVIKLQSVFRALRTQDLCCSWPVPCRP